MPFDLPFDKVDHPVFGDRKFCVQACLFSQIVSNGCVGNFDNKQCRSRRTSVRKSSGSPRTTAISGSGLDRLLKRSGDCLRTEYPLPNSLSSSFAALSTVNTCGSDCGGIFTTLPSISSTRLPANQPRRRCSVIFLHSPSPRFQFERSGQHDVLIIPRLLAPASPARRTPYPRRRTGNSGCP